MRRWRVAGGVIVADGALGAGGRILLVENRRRNGSLDWSTPGGVVDPGESDLGALTREVVEETGVTVSGWTKALYTVEVTAPDMGWAMQAVVHRSTGHSGTIDIDDPDQIVTQARWVEAAEAEELLGSSPVWLREPLVARWTSDDDETFWHCPFSRQEPRCCCCLP